MNTISLSSQAHSPTFCENYFQCRTDSPCWVTALKVASYFTLIIPAIIFFINLCIAKPSSDHPVANTPQFNFYKLHAPGHPLDGKGVTHARLRPSNFFFQALGVPTTLPGGQDLFAILGNHKHIREALEEKSQTDQVVSFSAPADLAPLFGSNTYKISYKEIWKGLESQKIFLSPLLPKKFYEALKMAMQDDYVTTLPGSDGFPMRLNELVKQQSYLGIVLRDAYQNPARFDLPSTALFNHTLYEIGSMVVKTEDYHVFVDGDMKLLAREPNQEDSIRLINACGIRGIRHTQTTDEGLRYIMHHTFATALIAAESGITIIPAVGMGVWGGPPEIYWPAFLGAVAHHGTHLEQIFVCPGHKKTNGGQYNECQGEEFQTMLDECKAHFADNQQALANLDKIVNLYSENKDMIQLARNLKTAHPDKIISMFNASDPDVTLGYHVGEYVNNMPHTAATTEEHLTALGSNGLCFEDITGVHESSSNRVIQVSL